MCITNLFFSYNAVFFQALTSVFDVRSLRLVYGEGGEIFDPDTKKPLGKLEIVKGTGRVVHVQPKMCTIRTDMEEYSKTKKEKSVAFQFYYVGISRIE